MWHDSHRMWRMPHTWFMSHIWVTSRMPCIYESCHICESCHIYVQGIESECEYAECVLWHICESCRINKSRHACRVWVMFQMWVMAMAQMCHTLQCVAVCCSVLQHIRCATRVSQQCPTSVSQQYAWLTYMWVTDVSHMRHVSQRCAMSHISSEIRHDTHVCHSCAAWVRRTCDSHVCVDSHVWVTRGPLCMWLTCMCHRCAMWVRDVPWVTFLILPLRFFLNVCHVSIYVCAIWEMRLTRHICDTHSLLSTIYM